MGNQLSGDTRDSGDARETGDGRDDRQGKKPSRDYWRSLLPRADTSPVLERDTERDTKRVLGLKQAVELAHRRYQENQAILSKLGYMDNELADRHDRILKAQDEALLACLLKQDQARVIDHFEVTSKPLLEFSQRIEAIKPYLETARQGFERFKESYEQGDQEWKALLAKTPELQLVYLGIKPCSELNKKDREILIKNSRDDFGVLEENTKIAFENFVMVFSDSNVRDTIVTYPRFFREYTPETTVPTYLSELGRQPKTMSREEYDIQRGLLFGFAPSAIKYFIKCQSLYKHFIPLMEQYRLNRSKSKEEIEATGEISRMNDGKLLNEYFGSNDIIHRNNHKASVLKIIEKYQPNMKEEAKQHLIRRGSIRLYGFNFVGDPASNEIKAFAQQIDDLLAVSGMKDFLKEVSNRPFFPPRRT